MLNLMPANRPPLRRLSRRELFGLSALSTLGVRLPATLAAAPDGVDLDEAHRRATAKNCIYIFLCGGPSQLEMWDPKPEAPRQIRGPFGAIESNVPGMRIGSLLPKTALHADKLALVRSMTHDSTSHDIGILYTLLASKLVQGKAYPPEPSDHPAIGAMLHKLLGAQLSMPPWVVVPRFFTTGSRFYKGQTAGFVGPAFDALALEAPKRGSLQRKKFELKSLDFVLKELDEKRFRARRSLLRSLEGPPASQVESPSAAHMRQFYDKAFRMLGSPHIRQAFDVTQEAMSLRRRYGLHEYGQSFLLARRLVERGVRMVNVFWTYYGQDGCQFNLWDNHGSDKPVCGGANSGVDMLTHDYCCPSFDQAFSTLLDDLHARGLLQETLVVVIGEFGRTPKINKFSGRDHWGACYSAALAGGGIQGGRVHGSSDGHAAYVKDSPVTPYDLHATILWAFGFPPETAIPDAAGRPVRITDGQPVTALF